MIKNSIYGKFFSRYDSKTPVVTSSISRYILAQSSGDTYKNKVWVLWSTTFVLCFRIKKKVMCIYPWIYPFTWRIRLDRNHGIALSNIFIEYFYVGGHIPPLPWTKHHTKCGDHIPSPKSHELMHISANVFRNTLELATINGKSLASLCTPSVL
jgi:hypothetical protein